MTDPVADIARAAARRLTTDRTPALVQDIDVALVTRDGPKPPDTYIIDPVSLGSLIVAIATLAWSVHNDLQNRTTRPDPEVLARSIRVRLRADGETDSRDRDRIVDVVIEETVRLGTSNTE